MLGANQVLSGVPANPNPALTAGPVSAPPPQNTQPTPPQPQPQQAPQSKGPGLFRRLVMGALAGVASQYEEENARTNAENAQAQAAQAQAQATPQRTAIMQQQANTEAANEQSEAQLRRYQGALQQVELQKAQRALALMPENIQQAQMQEWAQRAESLVDQGVAESVAEVDSYGDALAQSQDLMSKNKDFNYIPTPSIAHQGKWEIIRSVKGRTTEPTTVDLGGRKFTFPPGTDKGTIASAVLRAQIDSINNAREVEIARMIQEGANTRAHATTLRASLTTAQRNLTTLQNAGASAQDKEGILREMGIEGTGDAQRAEAIARLQQQIQDTQGELQNIGMGVAPANPPQQPNSGNNAAQQWSLSAWQKANPGGNAEAAVLAAQKKGYQVVK